MVEWWLRVVVVMGGGVCAGQFEAAHCSVDSSLEPIHCAPM